MFKPCLYTRECCNQMFLLWRMLQKCTFGLKFSWMSSALRYWLWRFWDHKDSNNRFYSDEYLIDMHLLMKWFWYWCRHSQLSIRDLSYAFGEEGLALKSIRIICIARQHQRTRRDINKSYNLDIYSNVYQKRVNILIAVFCALKK